MQTIRVLLLCLLTPGCLSGYAVLTHEAIIDSAWPSSIRPLLVKRFPDATAEQLVKAHAFAYGGCILQDMGYYPFGSKFFSDLVHYVRSADFVEELLRQSQDVNEYAFALGAMAHYFADTNGHAIAVNPSVALTYPKLRARYGPIVTYEKNPVAHMKVEFGFDVAEVASDHYSPQAYHDFIGFEVSKRLLEAAFRTTYGLEMSAIFADLDLALGTYRRLVSTILPEATKVAWQLKKDEIVKAQPGMTKRRFLYNLSRAGYEREWGHKYRRPGVLAKILAVLIRILPKIGPFRSIDFKPPSQQTEKLFMESFNATLARYRGALKEAGEGKLQLVNRDYDTGKPTAPGEYELADNTYSKLARTLAETHFTSATPGVAKDVLAFFKDLSAPIATKLHKHTWRKTLEAIRELSEWQASGTAVAPAL